MFDPTIYDNLKVVIEGVLYDFDREGAVKVIGREDIVDLAQLSRTFSMSSQLPEGKIKAKLILISQLADFATEMKNLRLAGDPPGAQLSLLFTLPVEYVKNAKSIDQYLTEHWDEATIHHVMSEEINLETNGSTGLSNKNTYYITLNFPTKVNESHMDDIEDLLETLLDTLVYLES